MSNKCRRVQTCSAKGVESEKRPLRLAYDTMAMKRTSATPQELPMTIQKGYRTVDMGSGFRFMPVARCFRKHSVLSIATAVRTSFSQNCAEQRTTMLELQALGFLRCQSSSNIFKEVGAAPVWFSRCRRPSLDLH